jgi:hypothetical protein
MVNIMNLFDRISNEQIVNVLFVRQLVIKLVSLVYSITIMICVLIDTRLCVHVVLMSISISFLIFSLSWPIYLIKKNNSYVKMHLPCMISMIER